MQRCSPENTRHFPQWSTLSRDDQLLLATRIAAENDMALVPVQSSWAQDREDVMGRLARLEQIEARMRAALMQICTMQGNPIAIARAALGIEP